MNKSDIVAKYLPHNKLGALLEYVEQFGYRLFGPVKRDDAIVYDELSSVEDLPVGWRDQQEGGKYHLESSGDASLFSYVVGPDSWKKYLFPPTETILKAEKSNGKVTFKPVLRSPEKRALIGVRPCELQAITIQDRVFIGGDHIDSNYACRREDLLLVVVNCSRSAATCFCVSMNSGPKAEAEFDLALTEICNQDEHYFVLEIGSMVGAKIIEELGLEDANAIHISAAETTSQNASKQQRALNTDGLKQKLYDNIDNANFFSDIASRCLSCGNCTMVCPTCFCSTIEDVTDLTGNEAERVRHWDSCFNAQHSYLIGGSVRGSIDSRYRQWLVHKLASWQDQFDSSGCVGCGRCITWCPVGIDITEEIDRLDEMIKITEKKG